MKIATPRLFLHTLDVRFNGNPLLFFFAAVILAFANQHAQKDDSYSNFYDLVVFGGTPAGNEPICPVIFMGNSIRAGESYDRVYVLDIAYTESVFLNLPFPSGNIGNPLNHLFISRLRCIYPLQIL